MPMFVKHSKIPTRHDLVGILECYNYYFFENEFNEFILPISILPICS